MKKSPSTLTPAITLQPPTLWFPVSSADRSQILTPPPHGHLGVLFLSDQPLSLSPVAPNTPPPPAIPAYQGHLVKITLYGELITQGVVTWIEPPGKPSVYSTQSLMAEAGHLRRSKPAMISDEWKVHWVPTYFPRDLPYGQKNPVRCPSRKGCSSRAQCYATEPGPTSVVRYRRCPECKTRWITVEHFQEIVPDKPRRNGAGVKLPWKRER